MKTSRTVLPWFVAAAALGLAAFAVFGAETVQDRRLRALEEQNEQSNRATAYRLCSRNTVDRAFAHSRIGRSPMGGAVAVAELEKMSGLPILNCKPNLLGLGATVLPPTQQREFVRKWERKELTGEQLGICPLSVIGENGAAQKC